MKKYKFQTSTEKQAKKLITKTFESELDDSQSEKYKHNKNKLFEMISKEVDCILDKEIEKVLQEQIFNAFKVPSELLEGVGTSTSAVSAKFQLEQFEKEIEKIKKLPPIAIELEVYPQGYNYIVNNTKNGIAKDKGIFGIDIIVVYDNEKFKFNQGRFIYSDGSDKIIELFEVN